MLQISIFWVVIIIFAIHTVLTHLFNWLLRKISTEEYVDYSPPVVMFQIMEIILIPIWLYNILS